MNATEGASVLTPADIHHIRTFIDVKYFDKPQSERSEILSDAIRRIIFQQLPDFAETIKKELTARLIRTHIVSKEGIVKSDDIFAACLNLNFRDQRIARPLMNWVEKKLDVSLEHAEFERILRRVRPFAASREEALLAAVADHLNLPETVSEPSAKRESSLLGSSSTRVLMMAVLSVMLLGGTLVYGWSLFHHHAAAIPVAAAAEAAVPAPKAQPAAKKAQSAPAAPLAKNELPQSLQYADIEVERLTAYLESRSSMLAKPRYMNAIIAAAKQYNVHPLLLFAITGQEQSFVPDDHKRAAKMANNPFNVHYSWQDFNTSIEESSRIAAKTVVNLSKNRPENADPLTWINRKYAEDPKWSRGVRQIFAMLQEKVAA
ncbi:MULTISPECIES: glucosaminidase domain-containing protein [unclassified Paenibacillus]|uniref:glucosaminidase domain-containing protein n=1 Tax=unclassified Paenibacillus TaxID=185978 RepID=UPI000970E397|nr:MULTISPECIES: glucosaminidase domain-containing protein [unclassified Paenibacillus]ASS65305.2 hypothetical protein CIC07_03610 [Paenibacillus sp. RUD330]